MTHQPIISISVPDKFHTIDMDIISTHSDRECTFMERGGDVFTTNYEKANRPDWTINSNKKLTKEELKELDSLLEEI